MSEKALFAGQAPALPPAAPKGSAILIEGEAAGRNFLEKLLIEEGYRVEHYSNDTDLARSFGSEGFSVVVVYFEKRSFELQGSPASLPETTVSGLSPRERQVLELLSEGITNAQIGKRLEISPNTVKLHLKSIFVKLGVNSRAAAVTKGASLVISSYEPCRPGSPQDPLTPWTDCGPG